MAYTTTPQVAAEIISHEGFVREAYRDSGGVWTWSIGITSSSGHDVYPRYKDNPQPLKKCFDVFEWALRTNYVPTVRQAFDNAPLEEYQFAAALSFHYNTGGIKRAKWVKSFKAGQFADAEREIMNWSRPAAIIPRRRKERDLFFKQRWSNNGTATEYGVLKPSYKPDFRSAKVIEIRDGLEELFGARQIS